MRLKSAFSLGGRLTAGIVPAAPAPAAAAAAAAEGALRGGGGVRGLRPVPADRAPPPPGASSGRARPPPLPRPAPPRPAPVPSALGWAGLGCPEPRAAAHVVTEQAGERHRQNGRRRRARLPQPGQPPRSACAATPRPPRLVPPRLGAWRLRPAGRGRTAATPRAARWRRR